MSFSDAFWRILDAVLELGISEKSVQNRPRFWTDFGRDFACILRGSRASFWEDSELKKRREILADSPCFFRRLRASFLGAPRIVSAPLSGGFWSLGRKGRTPVLIGPCQSDRGSGPPPEPPKGERERIENAIEFYVNFRRIPASFWEADGLRFGSRFASEFHEKRVRKFIDFSIEF